jgi:transcriptional regulator with GAF, ATPase, and Fis domain
MTRPPSSDPELLRRLDAVLAEFGDASDPVLRASARQRIADALATWDRAASDSSAAAAAKAGGQSADGGGFRGMLGRSPVMRELYARIEKFAPAKAPVLVHGESGTGKELVARALHDLGPRSRAPFVAENCAAVPEGLLESVLFGHVRGAFTGAVRDHPGHFVAAHGGTLFLDEIGDMPSPMQAKLLRALQEGEVRPVGGTKVRKVDVRVLAASHRDLEDLVRRGTFREDLLYRLAVLRLDVPPLRERGDDIVLLARRFLADATARSGRTLEFAPDAEDALAAFSWPGNVRQLQNEMQRVAAIADGPRVERSDLSDEIARGAGA